MKKEATLLWKKNEWDLLSALETTQAFLEDDITALGYFQDEYFNCQTPDENFKYKYKEMQNALETLFKSMLFNCGRLKEAVNKNYELRKCKEGNV